MLQYALEHEVLTFILVLAALWAGERVITAFINRNKPIVQCPYHEPEEGDEEEE